MRFGRVAWLRQARPVKAADDGSIFEAVGEETTVRLTRNLDADPNAWKARNGVGKSSSTSGCGGRE